MTRRENNEGGGVVEALIGLAVAVVVAVATTGVAVAMSAFKPKQTAVEAADDDLLTWAANHPDRTHAPNTPAEEGL